MKKIKKICISLCLLVIIFNCNMEEICKGTNGYENLEGCAAMLAIYSAQNEEVKQRSNLGGILTICLSQQQDLKKCKKQPSFWPIPDAIVD